MQLLFGEKGNDVGQDRRMLSKRDSTPPAFQNPVNGLYTLVYV